MQKNDEILSNIYCVIVIYNKFIGDSITFKCLSKINGLNLVICDNSTKNFNNKELANLSSFTYIDMNGNKGLSKAYNAAINLLQNKTGFLCLFDDDTFIPENYFDIFIKDAKNSNADIFLPIVTDEVGILSPCKFKGLKVARIKNTNELNCTNITGINSGMFINLGIFESYRYDESYFLDYIDHDFLRTMKKNGTKIKVLSVNLEQNFSGNNNTNLEGALKRFKIYKKDFVHFYQKNLLSRTFACFSILKRKIILSLRFKNMKFWFV